MSIPEKSGIASLANWANGHHYAVLLAPVAVFAAVFLLFPLVGVLLFSLREWELGLGVNRFNGIANYLTLVQTSGFLSSVRITFVYATGSVVLQVGGGLLIAQLLQREFKGKKIVIPLIILPSFATPAALSRLWRYIFQPDAGILNAILGAVGLPELSWIYDVNTVIPSLWLYDFWRSAPVAVLLLLGGFAGLPSDLYEAAKIDGASGIQRFFRITLPLLAPILTVVVVLSVIDNLKEFGAIWTLTQGGPSGASETLYIYAYKSVYQYGRVGLGSASGIVLFVLVFACSLLLVRGGRTKESL